MPTSISLLFSRLLFFRLLLKKKRMSSRRVESGFQSGHETQFVFSEGDIHESDADLDRRPALGRILFPLSIKLLRNILLIVRPFLFCTFAA